MAEVKHIGRLTPSKRKVVIAFRTIPEDPYHALVIPTDVLNDTYHNNLMNVVESTAGQESYELGDLLMRTRFSDGQIMLTYLHNANILSRVKTTEVEMTPTTTTSIMLSELNELIAAQRGVGLEDIGVQPPVKPDPNMKTTSADIAKVEETPAEVTISEPSQDLSPEDQAKHYRSQADKLAKQAATFRRLAEELAPTKKKTGESKQTA